VSATACTGSRGSFERGGLSTAVSDLLLDNRAEVVDNLPLDQHPLDYHFPDHCIPGHGTPIASIDHCTHIDHDHHTPGHRTPGCRRAASG
jgi:hypothetical protein